MNIEQAKTISIFELLNKLNINPAKLKDSDAWYLSPFRNEKTPSFHLHLKNNVWYDFGEALGGDAISFAVAYLKSNNECHTVSDALRWIKNMSNTGNLQSSQIGKPHSPKLPVFKMQCVAPLNSAKLIQYLDKRGIPLTLAKRHLKEVYFENIETQKTYFALGFKNEEGGYEIRNEFFKTSIGAKDISFVRGSVPKPDEIHLFEGFMDYLSAVAQLNGKPFKGDSIVLNSLSLLNRANAYINNYGYQIGYTWFDNDKAGEKATASIAEIFQIEDVKHVTMNKVYSPHKDVNAWHMHTLNLSL